MPLSAGWATGNALPASCTITSATGKASYVLEKWHSGCAAPHSIPGATLVTRFLKPYEKVEPISGRSLDGNLAGPAWAPRAWNVPRPVIACRHCSASAEQPLSGLFICPSQHTCRSHRLAVTGRVRSYFDCACKTSPLLRPKEKLKFRPLAREGTWRCEHVGTPPFRAVLVWGMRRIIWASFSVSYLNFIRTQSDVALTCTHRWLNLIISSWTCDTGS